VPLPEYIDEYELPPTYITGTIDKNITKIQSDSSRLVEKGQEDYIISTRNVITAIT
jgi:hypothetical protein